MLKPLAIMIALFFSPCCIAQALPYNLPVNGGVAIIPIEVKAQPTVKYEGHMVSVVASETPNVWYIVVGVPLDKTNAIQYLTMTKPFKAKIPFHINDKSYTTQHITLRTNKKVTPDMVANKRIAEETTKIGEIIAEWNQNVPYTKAFIAPVRGRVSSQFGLKRIYNKKPRNPHTGLDIAAPAGTPIKATAKGRVIATGDFFYTGNTVFIDHGQGLISLYAHMKNIDVHKGQDIAQGQIIGRVGKTGRATGPHLHWGMIMNQTRVNPLLFVTRQDIKPLRKKKVK